MQLRYRTVKSKRINCAAAARLLMAFARRPALTRQEMLDVACISSTALVRLLGGLEQHFGMRVAQVDKRYRIEDLGWFDFRTVAGNPGGGSVDRHPDAYLGTATSDVRSLRRTGAVLGRRPFSLREHAPC